MTVVQPVLCQKYIYCYGYELNAVHIVFLSASIYILQVAAIWRRMLFTHNSVDSGCCWRLHYLCLGSPETVDSCLVPRLNHTATKIQKKQKKTRWYLFDLSFGETLEQGEERFHSLKMFPVKVSSSVSSLERFSVFFCFLFLAW